MIKYDRIGRCDKCLKENIRVLITVNPEMIQGQICLKCFRGCSL